MIHVERSANENLFVAQLSARVDHSSNCATMSAQHRDEQQR
jgi:hypothetical protein